MDILPTLAALAGADTPTDRVIDGQDISRLLHDAADDDAEERTFYYYAHTHLQAVRHGKWKLHLPRPADPAWNPRWASHIAPEDAFEIENPLLFDLENDISERQNVAEANPEVVKKLLDLAAWARNDIGDYDRRGENARFFDPQPRRPDTKKWQSTGWN
jgi:arylsulfatase A-like enzyme